MALRCVYPVGQRRWRQGASSPEPVGPVNTETRGSKQSHPPRVIFISSAVVPLLWKSSAGQRGNAFSFHDSPRLAHLCSGAVGVPAAGKHLLGRRLVALGQLPDHLQAQASVGAGDKRGHSPCCHFLCLDLDWLTWTVRSSFCFDTLSRPRSDRRPKERVRGCVLVTFFLQNNICPTSVLLASHCDFSGVSSLTYTLIRQVCSRLEEVLLGTMTH